MASRLRLQKDLENLIGNKNVYYQPPSSNLMKYPAIRYSLSDIESKKADNIKYTTKHRYSVILITKNADDSTLDKLYSLDYCSFDRSYTSDNLYHHVFSLYY